MQSARKAPGPQSGLTVLEVVITIVVTTLALMAFAQSVVSTRKLGMARADQSRAMQAAHRMITTLDGETFSEVFARYNGSAADDPGGAGTAPGSGFQVGGLEPVEGDADGMVGEIVFPTNVAGTELREDVVEAALSMPRDVNADGVVDNLDHAGDYRLLPVLVRVEWRSSYGGGRTMLKTVLVGP